MLPDLGKYALPVLSAYGSLIILIFGLIFASLRRAKKSRETLAQLEQNRKQK